MEPAADNIKPNGAEPAPQAVPGPSQATPQPAPKVFKTTGEKWFDLLRFATGEGVILGLTAGLAYISRYGKPSYFGIPNVLKSSEEWMTKKLMPADPNNEFKIRLAGAVASTTVLMHGGNLFVPVMKGLQDKKAPIVSFFNKHFGNPGEVEKGNERLKYQTPESWSDIIKGRIASWVVVFSSFVGFDMLAGKKSLPDGRREYRFDLFEDKVGRLVSGLTEKGKEIVHTPLAQKLTDAQSENKAYRFGKILALDIFATTAALAIWNSVSKFSAIMRSKKGNVAEEAGRDIAVLDQKIPPSNDAAVPGHAAPADTQRKISHTARLGDRPMDYRSLAEKDPNASTMALS